MRKSAVRSFFIGASVPVVLAFSPALWAASEPAGTDALPGCELPPARDQENPLADREGELSRYEALPAHCLKAIVIVCGEAASQELLDLGSAATCSIGYEALLKRGFAGNFHALMAWWRNRESSDAFQ